MKRKRWNGWLVAVAFLATLSPLSNALEFTKSTYNVSFYENTITKAYGIPSERMGIDTGELLFGEAPNIRYKIVKGVKSAESYFKAEARQVGNFCFLLIRSKTSSDVLNRERTSQYKFSVRATVKTDRDEKEVAETEVTVTVLDRNDLNPLFFPSAYEVTVPRDLALHKSIVQVVAEDADLGVNGEIYYSLREATEVFAIHPLTGVVSLTRSLLEEEETSYQFTVLAADRGPKEAWQKSVFVKASLRINVAPVNLHDPVINVEHLKEVIEQSHADIYAIVRVTDPDTGMIDQQANLEIIDGDPDGVFRIKKGRTTNEFYVEMLKFIDRERTPLGYNLTLRATDGGKPPRSAAETLKVTVTDFNDHAPLFDKELFRVEISEVAPVGTPLLRLKVSDADQGKNAQVVFAIAGGNEYGCFRVNPQTGVLYIAQSLDAETRSEHTLTVSALDQASTGNRKQSSAKVHVKVLDANDNDPVFPTLSLDLDIDENEPAGSIVNQVSAKDADSGENGYVSYSIANLSPVPFEIDPFTGVIRTTEILDYETGKRKYLLKVRASDWGTPYRRQTELLLGIAVRDVNDNKPQFLRINCQVKVSRTTPFGSDLITVSAVDFDENVTVTYRVISGNEDGCFSLDAISGVISVSCDLTDVGTSERTLSITANDGQYFSDVMSVKIALVGSHKKSDTGSSQNSFSCVETPVQKKLKDMLELRESLLPTTSSLTVLPPLPSRFGQNIHSPEFVDFPAQLRVNESVTLGTPLLRLRAKDRDHGYNGLLVYAISGGDDDSAFAIDMETGLLKVAGTLDRERRAGYALNISVYDLGNPRRSVSKLLPVVVTDVNDNPPKFENPIITASIPETALVGTSVARLFASDADDGDNARVTYHLLTDTTAFRLDPLSGLLTVSGALDREQKGYYELLVTARDMGGSASSISPVLSAHALVRVRIVDVNDNAPKFATSTQIVKVREDIPEGSVIAIVSAIDGDSGDGGKIVYSIIPSYASDSVGNFSIDSRTGTVRLKTKLDYEERQIYNISVVARDSGIPELSSTSVLIVEVVDVNENVHSPRFEDLVTNFTVKENQPPGTIVGKVTAIDFDQTGEDSRIAYTITGGNGLGYFSVDNEGTIRTRYVLDRETKSFFWITILAADHGVVPLSASVEVFVEVEDVNDHIPLTDAPIYFASVPEHSPKGTLVLKVASSDEDGPKEKFSYQLRGDPQSFFSIDKNSGEIRTTSRSLDRESQSEHVLELVVSDSRTPGLSSSTRIVVTVQDINDHTPEFVQKIVKFVVASTIKPEDEIGQVLAFDKDIGANGVIEYSLVETGKSKSRFSINPVSGVITCQKPLQTKQDFAFDVKATDKGTPPLSAQAHVAISTVEIPEQSENPPRVEDSLNRVHLMEDEEVGTLVTGIFAVDDDGDRLWYSIKGGNTDDAFTIDRSSGQVYVRQKLDAETTPSYNLTIGVTDGSHDIETYFPTEPASANLEITVLDTNDNVPQFSQPSYEVEVSEAAELGTEVLFVSANDPDQNSKLLFAAHTASSATTLKKFRVEASGRVVIAESLDRETMAHHTLIVSVQDNGTPTLRNFARIQINVKDDNDHTPDFPQAVIDARIPETAIVGSTVAEVVAIDRDKGENAKLTYSIVSGNSGGFFRIDADTGRVSLEKTLDGQTSKDFSLNVRAVDSGLRPLSSRCGLHVTVVVADNSPPRFTKEVFETDVLESAPFGSTIITLETASASSPLFEILSGNSDGAFELNPTTGIMTVNLGLDYEAKRVYNMTVQATNMAGLKSSAIVLVHVRDANDNPPRFVSYFYEGVVSEAAAVNTVVYKANMTKEGLRSSGLPLVLLAEDEDSGINSQISYEIAENMAKAYFSVDSSTGAVKTIAPLDYETYTKFDFSVRIRDNGTPRLLSESHARIHVEVTDVNDCAPKFSQQIYNASLFLPTYPQVQVVQLQAIDPDSPERDLVYNIVAGNVDNKFAIDQKTGLVTVVNSTLLRPFYQLDVTVSDGHYSSVTLLTIAVDAIRNDSLTFTQSVFTGSVMENSTKVQRVAVLQIFGTELDEHVFFQILNPSDMFSIGKTSGVIYTTGKSFDREIKDRFDIFVEAKVEGGSKMAHTKVEVTVNDVNDNRPIFVNQPYYALVKMGSQKGDVIAKILAIDHDIKENGDIRYELLRGNGEFFKLAKKTGEITLRQAPHNHNGDYELAVVAYDEGSPALSSETLVYIKVVDHNSPVFEKSFYYAAVRENALLYSPIVSVSASNPIDRKLIYTITSGNDMEEFSLDFETAQHTGNSLCVLTLIAPLDYEQRQHYELVLRALDSVTGTFSEVVVAIDVLDVNDNYPEFIQAVYNVSVSEADAVGSTVLKLKAFDIDSGDNGKVFYQLRRDPDQPEVFRVDENTGVITFIKPLDYESQHLYHLTGIVTDLGVPPLSSSVHIWVNVKDENDNPPKFEQKDYSFLLSADAPRGQFLGMVKAWDPDWRDQLSLKYTITGGDEAQNFAIEESTGIVTLSSWNRFAKAISVPLNVSVTDGVYSASTGLVIQLLNVNSHSPTFEKMVWEATIRENLAPGMFVARVTATDDDTGDTERLSYSVQGQESSESFRIDEFSGEIYTQKSLDREEKSQYELWVRARDPDGKSGFALLKILVTDDNDNRPQFVAKEYNANIYANFSVRDSVILRVQAVDSDIGDNGRLRYSIYESSQSRGSDVFDINPDTGDIRLVTPLTGKENEVFQFFVRAEDYGESPLSAEVSATVLIMSSEDRPPRLEHPVTSYFLLESSPIGCLIASAKLLENGEDPIEFSIVSTNGYGRPVKSDLEAESDGDQNTMFAIDSEGRITLLRPVDREEQDVYIVMVKAATIASPSLCDVVTIVIQITDLNDSPPVFHSSVYTVSLPENTAKDTPVFKAIAEDADNGNNGDITYNVAENATSDVTSKFKIDPKSGWISTIDRLDRETQDRFVVPIVAHDNGSPKKSSATTLVVDLSDVNDNPSQFSQSHYVASVNEDVDVGTAVVTISTTDLDLVRSGMHYYITSGDLRSQLAVRSNGELYVARHLDREDISSYNLEVTATDGLFVSGTSVTVDVLDDNDNPPYCSKFRYKESISEGAPLGTLVFTAGARDNDEKANSKVRYFLTGDGADDFSIDSTSGKILVARMLDREERPEYRLVSHIQDRDKPQWECAADVIITVTDINDNAPQFRAKNFTVSVPEDLEVKNLITMVHASDSDAGNNRRVRYTLLSSSDGHFAINEISGIITLAKPLDRESQLYHNISVMAIDQGNPPLNTTTWIYVAVLDVNDNPPEFESKTYFASIEENGAIGTELIQLLATSLDTGVNAEIIYSILGGNEHRKFAINSKTGMITIVELLDFERANEYYLTIQAVDGGIPPLSNHATLNISVLDSNDNKPIFNHPSYAATVREDILVGEPVVKVTSNDPDSAENGRVSYRILAGDKMGQFVINPDTGMVSVNSALDREMVSSYILEIEARDNGVPTLASSVQVVIEVTDANDNAPQFSQVNYTTVAQEDKPLGFVILRLTVTDADTPVNAGPFSFEITAGNDDNSFRLDGDGVLRMARPLNHRLKDTYYLGVRVYDHGMPPLHSDTWVTVKVIEESRFFPIITPLEITINTFGEEFSGGVIGKVHATDQDPYDSLNFSVVPGKGSWNLFEVDKEDGTLIVKPGLDTGEYSVNISVSDGKYSSYSTVSVAVVPVANEALLESVILTIRDVTLEDFVLIYRKNLIKTIRHMLNVRTKDVHIISAQVSSTSSRRLQRDTFPLYEFLNVSSPVWRARENPKRPNIDILFAVQKASSEFYPASVLRKQLQENMAALESGVNAYVAGVVQGACTPKHCMHGRCEDRARLSESVTTVVTERLSFVTPKHTFSPVCVCKEGFMGERCEAILSECSKNPCSSPQVCVPTQTPPAYLCKCPDGFIGPGCGLDVAEQCEDNHPRLGDLAPCYAPRSPLSFTGKSYAQYSLATPIDKKVVLSLRLRTAQPTANIMFVAGRVDYSILEMVNGQVQYRFDCGSGEGLVRVSGTYVNDGKWHEIRLQRHGNKAELYVDGRFSAHGSAPGVNDVLNLENTDVYFGAEVRQLPGIPGFDDTRMGFIGCMDDIRVDRSLLPYHISGNYVVAASVPIGAPPPSVVATLRRFTNVEFVCRQSLIRPGLCGSQPCMNGGTCVEVGGVTYQCKCHDRFVGAKCEIDTDPCASSPCLYGGHCFNLQNDYRCQCPQRLTGKRCEYGRFCKPNPCKNGGVCEEGLSGPICKCKGFTGELCNTDVNECEPNPCHAGGTCLNMFGTFKCSCPPNATGQYCSEVVSTFGGVVGWFTEIPQSVAIGIMGAFVSLLVLIITVASCFCWRRKKRRSRRRYFDSNGREMMPLNSMRDCDYSKKMSKNVNLEAVASQVPPMLPPRPSSYTPSGNEQNYVPLNNLDTIRSYGSAGDELETLPMLNPYGQTDFSNLNNGGQIHEAFGLDEDEFRKQPWPEMEHNLAGKYYEKLSNDFKLKATDSSGSVRLNLVNNLKPNNKEMTVAYVKESSAGCGGPMSSTEDFAPGSSKAPCGVPPIPPLPRNYAEFQQSLHNHLGNRKDYHWDCSDWANTSTNQAEIAGGSVIDAASCHSHETSDSNCGHKLYGPPLDENGRLAVREPPIGACDAPLHSPTEQVSFEQIIAKSGLRLSQLGGTGGEVAPLSEISDLNESLPSPGNYMVHPNAYLPTYPGAQSETEADLTYADDDTEDDDAPSLLSVSIPSQIRLPDERLSLSASYAMRESMSDVSNVCDIEETDCEDSGDSHRSVMQTAL